MAKSLFGYFLFIVVATKVTFASAINLETSLKMAQCRAHCTNKFGDHSSIQDDKICKERTDCFMCWQTCEKLSTDYPIWSYNCGKEARCDSGCQGACDFMANHKDVVVPLSPHKSRLTLIFGGTSAQWSLMWGPKVSPQKAIFALFTRTSGKPWMLRVQTADFGASLRDVSSGTELKLVAVAESGLLSVIITPFDPPGQNKGAVGAKEDYPWNKDNTVEGDKEQGWPLFYEASVQASGLVSAKVWWSTQRPLGSNYLVTWEVSGGGLKGHLYTDLPEVDLTLWPETVYKVQVELVTGPLGDPRTSQLLILNTHNITFEAKSQVKQPFQPLVKPFNATFKIEILVGAVLGGLAALTVIALLLYKRHCATSTRFDDTSSSNSKLTLNRSIVDLTFEESLLRGKHATVFPSPILPIRHSPFYPFPNPSSRMGPQNTLGIPSSIHCVDIHRDQVPNCRKPDISII